MKFNSYNEPARLDAIREFESQRGIRLPEDYVEFLLRMNGGQLNPSESYAEIEGWNSLLVQELFGLTENPSHSIANDWFSNFADFIHTRMLQIGFDPFAQTLFMDLRDTSHGKIYIRAHAYPSHGPLLIDDTDFAPEDYEEAALFVPIADSFDAFIVMLGPEPD